METTAEVLKKNLPRLVDAVCEAYADSLDGRKWAPKISEGAIIATFCNEATNYVCKQMGYKKFDFPETPAPDDAFLANQMFDKMNADREWLEVDGNMAQYWANQGALVIAAVKNPNGHGHVAVVRPGEAEFSSNWTKKAPKVLNIGATNFIDRKASYAFRTEPSFFVLKEMT